MDTPIVDTNNTDTVLHGQLKLDPCPECGGAVQHSREGSDNYEECTKCDWVHCVSLAPRREVKQATGEAVDDEVDPTVREAESSFRIHSYLRNETATLAKWASGQLEAHPFADLFPMMSADEHARLVASIEATGFDAEDPVVLYNGKILDGRNRAAAAREVWQRHKDDHDAERYTPKFRDFQGSDLAALGYVKRHGLDRRQLSQSQVALIGAELHDRLVKLRKAAKTSTAPKARRGPSFAEYDDEYDEFFDDDEYDDEFGDVQELEGRSSAVVAGLTGASERSVERMNRLRSSKAAELLGEERQAEILEAIRAGTMTARAAEDELAAAKLAKAAARAKEEAEAAGSRASHRLTDDSAIVWPGQTLYAAHGRRLQQADALALLQAVEPHTAGAVVLDPPPWRGDSWKVRDAVVRLFDEVERTLAPGGDVWLVGEAEQLIAVAEALDHGWVQRACFAWSDADPLVKPWTSAPKFLVWLTRKGDRAPRDVGPAVEVLGAGPLFELGDPLAGDTKYPRHPQQRPVALFDGILAIGAGLVVVPYCGTGAAAVGAVRRGRPVIAGDVVAEYVQTAVLRCNAAAKAEAVAEKPKPAETSAEPKAAKSKKKAPPKAEPKATAKKATDKKATDKKATAKKATAKKATKKATKKGKAR